MVVCFSMGKNSEKMITKLKNVMDDVDFYTNPTIGEIVKEAKLRHINYKRIIIANTMIKDADSELKELYDFLVTSSASTEVVLMLNKGVIGYARVGEKFKELFNSPIYTLAIPEKLTISSLQDLIKLDIVEVGVKYENSEKLLKNPKESSEESTGTENDTSIGEMSSNNSSQEPNKENTKSVTNTGSLVGNTSPAEGMFVGNQIQNNIVPVPVGVTPTTPEISDDMGDELSLGSFGSSHSDTGFLDEDDEGNDEELQRMLAEKAEREAREAKEESERLEKERQLEANRQEAQRQEKLRQESLRKETQRTKVKQGIGQESSGEKGNIDILLSLRESNTTQEIIDECQRIVNEDHASVVIVDLDYKHNRVLSFLDVDKFYHRGNNCGIKNHRVYMEDGIGVVSNGYGTKLEEKEVERLFSSATIRNYDVVYIDCPLDCLSVLPVSILKGNSIILNPGVDITNFVSTSLLLTSRDVVSLEKEKMIMGKCLLDLSEDCIQEDLDLVKELCFFANGCWVDRVGL